MHKTKYSKADYEEELSFFSFPTTSSQYLFWEKMNDTSTDVGYSSKRYEYIKKIIDGSASVIFEARDRHTGDKVIIKKATKIDEWRPEITSLLRLKDSPSIVKLLDVFETNRHIYIVTEFFSYKDLFEHVDNMLPLDEKRAFTLFKEMVKCVKECHDRGIVHLDVKYENFFVRRPNLFNDDGSIPPNNIVLIDLGHSRFSADPSKYKKLLRYGTEMYACPESNSCISSDKSDVWSLGVCLAILLTDDWPFEGHDLNDYMYNCMHENVIHNPKVSKRAQMIINLCLKTDPRQRPTIDQLLKFVSHT